MANYNKFSVLSDLGETEYINYKHIKINPSVPPTPASSPSQSPVILNPEVRCKTCNQIFPVIKGTELADKVIHSGKHWVIHAHECPNCRSHLRFPLAEYDLMDTSYNVYDQLQLGEKVYNMIQHN